MKQQKHMLEIDMLVDLMPNLLGDHKWMRVNSIADKERQLNLYYMLVD